MYSRFYLKYAFKSTCEYNKNKTSMSDINYDGRDVDVKTMMYIIKFLTL